MAQLISKNNSLILAILLSLFVNHAKHVHRFFFGVNVCDWTFFFNATVHTTLPLTSSFLISLAIQFLCVSRFCFCVRREVCVYENVYENVYVYVY